MRLWHVRSTDKPRSALGPYRLASQPPVAYVIIVSDHLGGGLKALLLENISGVAKTNFLQAGFEVETASGALPEAQLKDRLFGVDVLGIRSKTRVTRAVIEAAPNLLAVGAFCIGVDQIDRSACSERGIGVFNDPHSNSRSVAELALGEIIMLVRRVFAASSQMHAGGWNKSASGCHEVRGMTLGIVGYGRIGSQLSDLAEAAATAQRVASALHDPRMRNCFERALPRSLLARPTLSAG